jgi:hypothetical protein
MQASDVNGKLIMPAEYMETLPTACSWVRFTLEKFQFCDKGNRQQRDTFIAEIDSIRAITRPKAVTAETMTPHSSPKKQRIIYRTDPLSPSKGKGKGKA